MNPWRNMQIKDMKPWNTCLLRTMRSIMLGVFEGFNFWPYVAARQIHL